MSTEDIGSVIARAAREISEQKSSREQMQAAREEEHLEFQRRCIDLQQKSFDAYLAELKDVQEHRRKAEESSRRSCECLEQIVQLLREAKADQ